MIDINQALVAIAAFVGLLFIVGIAFTVITIRRNRRQSKRSMPQYGADRSNFGENLRRKQNR